MAAWPGTLPASPLAGTTRVAKEANVAQYKGDVGDPLRRKRFTAARRIYESDWMLTTTQYTAVNTFFDVDCAYGALSFTKTDWISGGTKTFMWEDAPAFVEVPPGRWRMTTRFGRAAE